jgi:uncharacterized protein YcbX
MTPANQSIGSVVSLWRYPVKSMQGEELNAADVTERGLLGDRAYALVDSSEGKVGSAKNPRKWPNLFEFRAVFAEPPRQGAGLPLIRITLPDGTVLTSDQGNLDGILSTAAGRAVMLRNAAPAKPVLEEYWPDVEGLPHRDKVTDEAIAAGLFFDAAAVHVLTTATLERLRELYPQGRFEVRRFRPNVVVALDSAEHAFAENQWVGRTLLLGNNVRLQVTGPCPRCVMTTLPQADLPKDLGILRTAAQHNQGNVGIYASVVQAGRLRRGDSVRLA